MMALPGLHMNRRGLAQEKVGVHVGAKRAVEFLGRDLRKILVGHLECRVVHEHVDLAEALNGGRNEPVAVRLVADVARHGNACTAFALDKLLADLRVGLFFG